MEFYERLSLAIEKAKESKKIESVSDLSKKVGAPAPSSIDGIIKEKRKSSKYSTALSKALGVRIEWLTSGEEPMIAIESNVGEQGSFELWSSNDPLPSDEYASIPFLKDVEFQGGAGAFEVSDYNGFKLPFAKSTLHKKNVKAKDAVCVTLTGDSMEPVMPKGTSCGINTADKTIIDGEHYAINHGGLLRIKKLYRLPNNQLKINSWNEVDHPDEIVNIDEIEIVGKVFYWSVMP